jgi:hypothetical protein
MMYQISPKISVLGEKGVKQVIGSSPYLKNNLRMKGQIIRIRIFPERRKNLLTDTQVAGDKKGELAHLLNSGR